MVSQYNMNPGSSDHYFEHALMALDLQPNVHHHDCGRGKCWQRKASLLLESDTNFERHQMKQHCLHPGYHVLQRP